MAPNPVLVTGTNATYDPNAYVTTTYQQPAATTTYTYNAAPTGTYTNYVAPAGSEVRNTTYNYGTVTGAGNVGSTVRNTVVTDAIAPPPKITFGQYYIFYLAIISSSLH